MIEACYSFGTWVRQRRKALRFTCEQLAQQIGCATVTLRKIERDERRPSSEIATLLAKHLVLPAEQPIFVRAARGMLPVDMLSQPTQDISITLSVSTTATLTISAPPPTAPSAPALLRTKLPRPAHTLLGRTREYAELRALLAEPELQLLTLTGAGGSGKTSLALALVARIADGADRRFADGVHFVDLAPINDAELVGSVIAHSLGMPEVAGMPIAEHLINVLRDKKLLLILDNVEQLLEARLLLCKLLNECPALVLLVTSRVPLQLSVEREYPVEPLTDEAAVQLFTARAQAVRPGFVLNEANRPVIVDICQRLDRLPLALELAAARIKLFTPQTLLARLQRSGALQLLTDGPRDLPARQQTIRATLAWSDGLLHKEERKLFWQLGVFAGGFTEDAVSKLSKLDSDQTLELLSALVNHNLVHPMQLSSAEPRFTLLETVREYALAQLRAEGHEQATRQRHAHGMLALAEAAQPYLCRPEQIVWLDALEHELENIRGALEWAHTTGNAELLARISTAMLSFWELRDHEAEGRSWLEAAYAQRTQLPPQIRAALCRDLGYIRCCTSDRLSAEPVFEEARQLYTKLGDEIKIAWIAVDLGFWAMYDGQLQLPEHIRVLLEQKVVILRAAGAHDGVAWALCLLALHARALRQHDLELLLLQESLGLQRHIGDRHGIAWILLELSRHAVNQIDFESAVAYNQERLELERELGHKRGEAASLMSLLDIATFSGRFADAFTQGKAAMQIADLIGADPQVLHALSQCACLALTAGDHANAAELAAWSMKVFTRCKPSVETGRVLFGFGSYYLMTGDFEQLEIVAQKALSIGQLFQDIRIILDSKWLLGAIAFFQDDTLTAVEIFEADIAALRGTTLDVETSGAIIWLGRASTAQGRYSRAATCFAESMSILRKTPIIFHMPMALEACATLAATCDDHERAARLWGQAEALREETGSRMWPVERPGHEQHVATIHQALGDECFSRCWQAGRALRWEEAFDETLVWLAQVTGWGGTRQQTADSR